MNNFLILPIIIPLLIGMLLIIFPKRIAIQRWGSLIAIVLTGVVTFIIINEIKEKGIQTLQLGGWQAPFGIGLVADMFSTLLVMTTSIVALACLFFAIYTIGEKREKTYFYPIYLFLIAGINGAFLTGDLFNLYVFFELLLVASYVLISLGSTKRQLSESIKYVLVNVVSSVMFLLGIAYIYAIFGTLNFAHLSVRIAEVGQDGIITTVAILFLIVFGIKAALFLFHWLPGAYSAPPTAVSAIFAALLTKVGIYSIIRTYTLLFYHEPETTHLIIGVLSAITMVLGAVGAIGYWDINKILTFNVIIGVGFILSGLASFSYSGLFGSINYLIHDMVIKALIFLIGGVVIQITGTNHLKEMSGLIRMHPFLGWCFFIAALSIAGIPPLSGFLGKIFITKGTFESEMFWLGAFGLATSLMVLYSVMKIFMNAFWGETVISEDLEKGTMKGRLIPIALLTFVSVTLGIGAEGIQGCVRIAVEGLLNPSLYIEAVFSEKLVP